MGDLRSPDFRPILRSEKEDRPGSALGERASQGSSPLRTAVRRFQPSRISALASATASMVPRKARWTGATFVMTAMSGSDFRQRPDFSGVLIPFPEPRFRGNPRSENRQRQAEVVVELASDFRT